MGGEEGIGWTLLKKGEGCFLSEKKGQKNGSKGNGEHKGKEKNGGKEGKGRAERMKSLFGGKEEEEWNESAKESYDDWF
ncbi:uncharacterized protein MONOS_5902 [Monocercomonoides exilis]|uniref:uncharacterized protein n=1 Tax=Monocercomonoides exilis TaxID=2049356 RepID=UPI00355A12D4|nr:hypothetical protein MONOS_5902 [Monocercomonoides exilis]|eukprot:MONOS_5902.1-p1 / transcript=MONOS_5902.1 / gene=MONOS_5902 / organism=Monocercomonoides_exilis_PA203 / gene_product=unspecified product / transcript_product=unspecified product / location=Mono_scaffold00178:22159-22395(-) / protein_length=79 / sequence_SO=supercontig / SO=protein_coding / is_pseudo=false